MGQDSHERTTRLRRETLTTPKVIRVECPVCEGRLKGAALLGYYCTRCGAHYSAPRVRQLQREHLHHKIQSHFSERQPDGTNKTDAPDTPERKRERTPEPRATLHEETTHIVIADDDGAIAQAITEARLAIKETTHHLEDILGAQQEDTTKEDTTSDAEHAKEDRTPEHDEEFDTTKKDETQPSSKRKTLRYIPTTRIPHKKEHHATVLTAPTTPTKTARQRERVRDSRKKKITTKMITKQRATKTLIIRNSRQIRHANTKKHPTAQSSRPHSRKPARKRARQQSLKQRKKRSKR